MHCLGEAADIKAEKLKKRKWNALRSTAKEKKNCEGKGTGNRLKGRRESYYFSKEFEAEAIRKCNALASGEEVSGKRGKNFTQRRPEKRTDWSSPSPSGLGIKEGKKT